MNTVSQGSRRRCKYHPHAYEFVFAGLRHAQEQLGRNKDLDDEDAEENSHISGPELLLGIRDLVQKQYGLLGLMVLNEWGIVCTEDFGRIVFELIDRGEMRKTDRDQLSDFLEVYDFQEAFVLGYRIETAKAFHR